MRTDHAKRTILVAILGSDISKQALATARFLVAGDDAQLVLLHVARKADSEASDRTVAKFPTAGRRWQRLALAAPHRTFLEAVVGSPAEVVLSEARRFHSDTIVMSEPSPAKDRAGWIENAIDTVVRSAPASTRVLTDRRRPLSVAPTTRRRRPVVPFHSEASC